jgi:hypothetical protein
MKTFIIVALALSCILFNACKKCKTEEPDVNVKGLILGKWRQTQYKQGNENWRDSTGTFYNFISDTLVNTKIFNSSCDRRYTLENPSQVSFVKGIQIYPNYSCLYQDWYFFSITSINNSQFEATYRDDVGGVFIQKYEKFVKE